MNEITRIHIAKVAYDVELSAKKQLEKYLHSIESYASKDVLEDVEVRITELLGERGVTAGGVVTVDDVKAIRETLGEPYDFADEGGDIALGDETSSEPVGYRRLYRDTDNALVGGVLSGIAAYFKIDPTWVRLIFVVLLIASFGTVLVVYAVLWLVVPAARSAAEKLQLAGRPVTLGSIRELSEVEEQKSQSATPRVVRSVLRISAGALSSLAALGSLATTVVGAWAIFGDVRGGGLVPYLFSGLSTAQGEYGWAVWVTGSLLVISGLLLTTLFSLIAYAIFSAKFTKRIGLLMLGLVVAGILSFGTALGVGVTSAMHFEDTLQREVKETKVTLPSDFAAMKQLRVSAHSVETTYGGVEMAVEYIVDPGKPRYVLVSLSDVRPEFSIQDGQARVVLKKSGKTARSYGGTIVPRLVVYGPALDTMSVEQGEARYTAGYGQKQASLHVDAAPVTAITMNGEFEAVRATGSGTVDASSAWVGALTIEDATGGTFSAGVVRTLTITQPDVCPVTSEEGYGRISVRGVASGEMTYNQTVMPAKTHKTACGGVLIGDREEETEG